LTHFNNLILLLDLKFPELDQIVGQIYQLSKYQQGCRFLQKKLEEDAQNATVILKELFDHLVELMTGTNTLEGGSNAGL
jgi:hypothetical protein